MMLGKQPLPNNKRFKRNPWGCLLFRNITCDFCFPCSGMKTNHWGCLLNNLIGFHKPFCVPHFTFTYLLYLCHWRCITPSADPWREPLYGSPAPAEGEGVTSLCGERHRCTWPWGRPSRRPNPFRGLFIKLKEFWTLILIKVLGRKSI